MTQVKSLDRRLRRLEIQNNILGAILAGCLLIGLLGVVDANLVMRVNAVHMIDENGTTRVELSMRDGVPGLHVMDAQGVTRLSATHDEEQTGLFVKDADGTTRIGVAQFAHGGGGFALHGPESKGAAVLYLKENGSLRFYDESGQVVNEISSVSKSPGLK